MKFCSAHVNEKIFADVSVAEGQCFLLDVTPFSFVVSAVGCQQEDGTGVQMKLQVCSSYIICLDVSVWLGQFQNQNVLVLAS